MPVTTWILADELVNPDTLTLWLEFVKYFGAGAAAVLGPICWLQRLDRISLEKTAREEVVYNRTREIETMNVMKTLTVLIERDLSDGHHKESEVANGLRALREDLKEHIDSVKELIREHSNKARRGPV